MDGQRPRFHSIPLRTRRPAQPKDATMHRSTRQAPHQSYVSRAAMPVMPDDNELYEPRTSRTSTIRYTDEYDRTVLQQGNRRLVLKDGKPPRRIHWLFPAGVGMLAMFALTLASITLVNWWDAHQLDSQYGYPRIWETDQVLGIDHDSPAHKSHLIFQNLDGHVFFIVIPAGNIAHARLYNVTTLYGQNASSVPITADFEDLNGKIAIVVEIGDQGSITFVNDGKNGFKPEPPQ
jgi:hypothetical protein